MSDILLKKKKKCKYSLCQCRQLKRHALLQKGLITTKPYWAFRIEFSSVWVGGIQSLIMLNSLFSFLKYFVCAILSDVRRRMLKLKNMLKGHQCRPLSFFTLLSVNTHFLSTISSDLAASQLADSWQST